MCISNTRPIVPPLHKRTYMFIKDLKHLTADLETTDNELAVIQRYKNALAVKGEVRC